MKKYRGESYVKKLVIVVIVLLVLVMIGILALSLYGKHQMSKIPNLSFEDALEYTTKDNPNAVITVGIIKDGEMSYTVYGENGAELPKELHTYEIGSITKTFTASLINKAILENKIDLEATIDQYLDLPKENDYPTIRELLTHTSGYKSYYFASPMVPNFFKGRNDFYGITKEMLLNKASKISVSKDDYSFNYSNYGYAILGLILENVYENDYATLMNDYINNELGLYGTKISDQMGDLGNYWDWNNDDAYLSAGAITSDINDMLMYAQIQLDKHEIFTICHESLKTINASTEQYKLMDINLDEIGMAWIIDNENGIVWHNGGTGNYNSYIGFNSESGVAVVVLSNLPPSYRIPATVLGVKALKEITNQS